MSLAKSSDGDKETLEKFYKWVRSIYHKSESPEKLQELEVEYHSNRECFLQGVHIINEYYGTDLFQIDQHVCISGLIPHFQVEKVTEE